MSDRIGSTLNTKMSGRACQIGLAATVAGVLATRRGLTGLIHRNRPCLANLSRSDKANALIAARTAWWMPAKRKRRLRGLIFASDHGPLMADSDSSLVCQIWTIPSSSTLITGSPGLVKRCLNIGSPKRLLDCAAGWTGLRSMIQARLLSDKLQCGLTKNVFFLAPSFLRRVRTLCQPRVLPGKRLHHSLPIPERLLPRNKVHDLRDIPIAVTSTGFGRPRLPDRKDGDLLFLRFACTIFHYFTDFEIVSTHPKASPVSTESSTAQDAKSINTSSSSLLWQQGMSSLSTATCAPFALAPPQLATTADIEQGTGQYMLAQRVTPSLVGARHIKPISNSHMDESALDDNELDNAMAEAVQAHIPATVRVVTTTNTEHNTLVTILSRIAPSVPMAVPQEYKKQESSLRQDTLIKNDSEKRQEDRNWQSTEAAARKTQPDRVPAGRGLGNGKATLSTDFVAVALSLVVRHRCLLGVAQKKLLSGLPLVLPQSGSVQHGSAFTGFSHAMAQLGSKAEWNWLEPKLSGTGSSHGSFPDLDTKSRTAV
ncbi:hypothetical protein OE88DRAFT_1649093 [Heliocybe sulcata]|uniref:Uncharacterized protein n=1 Tax=Heliocybe sulcata TaxID=5364 RepID=A0A5C3MK27_9AGAM|nr:hypothetical protein OE88DRAFT_1649093 [Heliocybe sulcata]